MEKKICIKNNLEPFLINRTNIDIFFECKKCFYIKLTREIRRPHGPPLVINNLIIDILKKEFDAYRNKKEIHLLLLKKKKVPFEHQKLNLGEIIL